MGAVWTPKGLVTKGIDTLGCVSKVGGTIRCMLVEAEQFVSTVEIFGVLEGIKVWERSAEKGGLLGDKLLLSGLLLLECSFSRLALVE